MRHRPGFHPDQHGMFEDTFDIAWKIAGLYVTGKGSACTMRRPLVAVDRAGLDQAYHRRPCVAGLAIFVAPPIFQAISNVSSNIPCWSG